MGKIYEQYGWFGVLCVIIVAIAIIFGALCLDAWLGLLLWDWVIVDTLGWVEPGAMTFWPMFGLLLLSNLLFKTPNFGKNKNDNNEKTPRS